MFSKTKYVDICKYHNQTFDFLHAVSKQTNYFPKKLINFDLHSDMKCNKKPHSVNGANWVNWTINKFNIDEYYWVLPKSILHNEQMLNHCFGKICEIKNGRFGNKKKISNRTCLYGNFTDNDYKYSTKEPLKQFFIVDKETNEIFAKYANLSTSEIQQIINSNENYRLLTVYTCTEDNLPNLMNEDVIVTIDGDYFTNNGYDTFFNYSYDTNNIKMLFNNILQCFKFKHIKPVYLSLSMSKNYSLHHEELINFFKFLKDNCKNKQDIRVRYIHTDLKDDPYTRVSIIFDKEKDKITKISNNVDLNTESQLMDYISKKFKDNPDGNYNFLVYVKEVVNKTTMQPHLLIYPDKQQIIQLSSQ